MALALFYNVILPVLLILAVGVWIERKLTLDLPTLSSLNFHVFVPALAFAKLVSSDLSAGDSGRIAVFVAAHAAIMGALAFAAAVLVKPLRQHRTVLMLASMFHNAGNYGIPFVLLAFGEQMLGVAIVVLVTQNVLSFTAGVVLIDRDTRAHGIPHAVLQLARVPVVWACLLALVVRATAAQIPAPLLHSIGYLGDGLIPVALLTLGIQLSRSQRIGAFELAPTAAATTLRLLISPLTALLLCVPLGFGGEVRAVLIATAGLPVAVNVFILAVEYRRDESAASQMIFWSTVLSCLTLVALLAVLQ